MGKQRKSLGTQVVTHADQLKPSRGHKAIIIAADGDMMELTYDSSDLLWKSAVTEWSMFPQETQDFGYGAASYQGNDASMTVFMNGWSHAAIADGALINNRAGAAMPYSPQLPTLGEFHLRKWINAGLELRARATHTISNVDSTADGLHIGMGIYTWNRAMNAFGEFNFDSFAHAYENAVWIQSHQTLSGLAASYYNQEHVTDWFTLGPLGTVGVFPCLVTGDSDGTNASSYAGLPTKAVENGQTMLLAVLTYREDATTPTTPTITASTVTWVQVAETAFDVTGNMRAKLTLFRAQANADGYYDTVTIDYGGVTQNGIVYLQYTLIGEDRGGTNGSAAVVQSATGTASGDADVSATLAAFGAAENITFAFVGLTDDAVDVSAIPNWSEWDDFYGYSTSGATYFTGLYSAFRLGNDTSPTVDVVVGDAAGMIAVELKADQANVEPLIGEIGLLTNIAAPVTDGVSYQLTPKKLERMFVA